MLTTRVVAFSGGCCMFVAIYELNPTATAKHREVVIEVTLECVEVLKNTGQVSESVLGTRNQGSITHRLAAGTYVHQTPSNLSHHYQKNHRDGRGDPPNADETFQRLQLSAAQSGRELYISKPSLTQSGFFYGISNTDQQAQVIFVSLI